MKQQNWKLVLTPKANRKIFMIFKSNLSNNQYTIRFFHAIEKQFSYLDDSNLDISSRLWLLLKQQESSFSGRKKKVFYLLLARGCSTLYQKSISCPKVKIWIFGMKNHKNHFLGWLTSYRLVWMWVEFYR